MKRAESEVDVIYGVGTGRCGTATLAHQLSGLHEPEPNIVAEATDYYHGNCFSLWQLLEKLRIRAALDTPAIIDNKQSFVISLIIEVDPTAEFTVLVREPVACVRSFVLRKAYNNPGNFWDDHRLCPQTGFPRDWTQTMQCAWLWIETHRVILSALGNRPFEITFTHELGDTVMNASPDKAELEFNPQERAFFDRFILPFWKNIQTLARRRQFAAAR